MATILNKREVVLDFVGADRDGDVVFSNDRDISLAISLSTYADMDRPEKITATIAPGDQMNPEVDEQ